ncbi:hypothetical protein BVY02_02560 [bacterium J17]|nr:hypothetical protein BVY02_02560 [bacterium J17]
MNSSEQICPLCHSPTSNIFHSNNRGRFYACESCCLVFLEKSKHLSKEEELERYKLHQNYPNDPGYRRFLMILLRPLLEVIAPESQGLDFGSGPGPTSKIILEGQGHSVTNYDPFFEPNISALKTRYDFVACSEVVEHFRRPAEEFELLNSLLKPGGVLGIMTNFLEEGIDFANWHYQREPSHLCFYNKYSMYWLSNQFSLDVEFPAENVALFYKYK